jgi:uncharacterized protein
MRSFTMIKKSFFGIVMIVTALLLAQQSTEAGQEKPALPRILNVGSDKTGSLTNIEATAVGSVLGKSLDSRVRVMATTGAVEWVPMLQTGEVDIGILSSKNALDARGGKGGFAPATGGKGVPIRLLVAAAPQGRGVLVAGDSGIKNGADLKGKRYVGEITGNTGATALVKGMLANWALTPSDVKMISVPSLADGMRRLIERRVDATTIAVGGSAVEELEAARGARFLSADPSPEAVKRFHEYMPADIVLIEPGPGKTGVREPTYMPAFPSYLVGSEKLSDDAAYAIVKALWEHDRELGVVHDKLKDWTKKVFVTGNPTIPYHPGAIKFYKEVGVWGPEQQAKQTKLLSVK